MSWRPIASGKITQIDWSAGRRLQLCDPYLVWFDLTHQPPENNSADVFRLDVLVELPYEPKPPLNGRAETAWKWLVKELRFLDRFPRLNLPADHPRPKNFPRFLSGTLPASMVGKLVDEVNKTGGGKILRFELATPRATFESSADKQTTDHVLKARVQSIFGYWKLLSSLPSKSGVKSGVNTLAKEPLTSVASDSLTCDRGPLVCVIDDLCNFSSRSLRGRVKTLWHQGQNYRQRMRSPPAPGEPDAWGWSHESPFDPDEAVRDEKQPERPAGREHYGRLRAFDAAQNVDEVESYRRAAYAYPMPLWSHGSSVLYAISSATLAPVEVDPDHSHRALAPESIHFVQLPDKTVLDTSGGSLSGYAVDGLHRAVRLAAHGRQSVIVNLSYGTNSGPHDGTSMFERAMLDLLDLYDGQNGRPNLHIVLPAGNSHLWRAHAGGWLGSSSSASCTHTLRWKVLPDDETDNFIEVWFSPNTDVSLRLISPTGVESPWISPGTAQFGKSGGPEGVIHAAVIYPDKAAQGKHGRMALVALGPTVRRALYGKGERFKGGAVTTRGLPAPGQALERVAVESAAGVWKIELRSNKNAAAGFHAWVQRDDAAPGRSRASHGYRGRQSRLLDDDTSQVDPCFTLNGIATAVNPGPRRMWVVGAMDQNHRLSRYASAGPDRDLGHRCEGPDVVMTVDRSRNQPGRLVGGMLTGARVRVAGTSIGAAVFTRMLHHALAKGGPTHQMAWVLPSPCPPDSPPVAGEPVIAPDAFRGEFARLAALEDIALPGPK